MLTRKRKGFGRGSRDDALVWRARLNIDRRRRASGHRGRQNNRVSAAGKRFIRGRARPAKGKPSTAGDGGTAHGRGSGCSDDGGLKLRRGVGREGR